MLHASAADLHVFAAASLTDAMKEIGDAYEKQSGTHVAFNFGASSLLERQIEEKAPADIFFSADEAKMDQLQQRGLIDPATRHDLLGNSLVVVAPSDSSLAIATLSDLTKPEIRKIALADPQAVPAGLYAKAALTKLKLWDTLQPKIVPTENVRAALAAVESGNTEVAFVYKTDAMISKKVHVIFSVAPDDAGAINYPVAILKETTNRKAAEEFVRYLDSAAAKEVFQRFEFIVKP